MKTAKRRSISRSTTTRDCGLPAESMVDRTQRLAQGSAAPRALLRSLTNSARGSITSVAPRVVGCRSLPEPGLYDADPAFFVDESICETRPLRTETVRHDAVHRFALVDACSNIRNGRLQHVVEFGEFRRAGERPVSGNDARVGRNHLQNVTHVGDVAVDTAAVFDV